MNKVEYPHRDRPWMKYYDEKMVSRQVKPKTNLTHYLKTLNGHNRNRIAGTYYGKPTSYGDFFEYVDNYSRMFTGLGVKESDRIMDLVPNIPESGQLWLGATQIGSISDFIDPRPDTSDLEANARKTLDIIKHEKAKYIIALDSCYLNMLTPIEHELKDLGINQILTVSAADSMNLLGRIDYLRDVINYNKLRNERIDTTTIKKLKWYEATLKKIQYMEKETKLYDEAVKNSPLEIIKCKELVRDCRNVQFQSVHDENLVNYIGHTSGTSGSRPKPIPLTNANKISAMEQLIASGVSFKPDDRVLHVLPFFSPLGADNNYILSLASGSNNIHVPEFEINEFGYLIKKYRPNVIIGTPSWLASLPDCKYLDDVDLSCLTRVIYGGDSMSRADEERLNKWLRVHGSSAVVEKGHGMSEYCGCGSYAKDEYNEYESIGIPLSDTIYTVVESSAEEKMVPIKFEDDADSIVGELAVSSPAVTGGELDGNIIVPHYELEGNSYIRTRDIVTMDRDGKFYFVERKDRSFTRFDGYKVKPHEIEKVILENEKIRYCEIVPYHDFKQRGNMPIAHIVLNDNETLSDDEYTSLIEEIVYKQIIANPDMSSRQIPAKFRIREDLPKTKNGKVDFNKLIKEGLDGTEISVDVEETNLSVGDIKIYRSNQAKTKVLK